MTMQLSGSGGITFPSTAVQGDAGIGYGQTWQAVTGSRSGSTTYTNSTGKPIMVCVTAAGTPSGVIMTVSGVSVAQSVMGAATSGNWGTSVIVPNGETYSTVIYGSLLSWAELR